MLRNRFQGVCEGRRTGAILTLDSTVNVYMIANEWDATFY